MTRGDKFLLAGLLFISLLSVAALYGSFSLFTTKVESVQAVISSQGRVIRRIDLPAARSAFVLQGKAGAVTVEADGARIRMLEASCPGRVCVRQGWIKRPGQSIVCIPGEILIRIEGVAALDAVSR